MKVLVTGGRDFDNLPLLYSKLSELNITTIIHGGARGADTLADEYAKNSYDNINVIAYPLTPKDWQIKGKAAGIIRNIEMYDLELPDLVVAFPGGKGTAHMVNYARKKGCKVLDYRDCE